MSDGKKILQIVSKGFRYLISNLIFWRKNTIIIAGLGRSGTTLLYNSIADNHYYKKQDELIKFDKQKIYKRGYVYKTHDYPPKGVLPKHVKVVFMYGNIYNTVISTHAKINEWYKKHHYHLSSEIFKPNDEIFYKDIFQFEKQFESWKKSDALVVTYEKLYTNETQLNLSNYLGFKIKMIKRRERKSSFKNHPMAKVIMNTYTSLFKKMNIEE